MTEDEKLRQKINRTHRNFRYWMGGVCTATLATMIWTGVKIYEGEKMDKTPETQKCIQDCLKNRNPKP